MVFFFSKMCFVYYLILSILQDMYNAYICEQHHFEFSIHCLQDFEDHFANHEINNSRSSKSDLASSVLLLYSFMFDIYGIPITIYKMGFQISSPLEWSLSRTNERVSSVRLLAVRYMIYAKTVLNMMTCHFGQYFLDKYFWTIELYFHLLQKFSKKVLNITIINWWRIF